MSSFCATLLLLCLCCVTAINCLQYTVKPGEEVCISDIVPSGELLTGEYTIAPPSMRCSINVYDPNQVNLFSRGSDEQGKFSIAANSGMQHSSNMSWLMLYR